MKDHMDEISAVLADGRIDCTIADAPDEDGGIFLIMGSWRDVSLFQEHYNELFCPETFAQWRPVYEAAMARHNAKCQNDWQKITPQHLYEDMRLGINCNTGEPALAVDPDATYPYLVPDGFSRLGDVVIWGFADEWTVCDNCNSLIRTSPDSYGWQPDYVELEDDRFCCACVADDSDLQAKYIEYHCNANRLLNLSVLDISSYGWEQLDVDYENGMHPGQNDDPNKIVSVLNAAGIDCIFTGSVGQFDVAFNVWVPEGQSDQAESLLNGTSVQLPYDQAHEMEKALKGQPSVYQVTTRMLTPEEFISGDWAREV